MPWLLTLFAYLLGSLSFAIILCHLAGLPDPRTLGSGNPGATNMLRLGRQRLAIFTLLGDLGKGLVPVLVAAELGLTLQQQAWVGLAAVLGHLYPVFFHFQGGKGVATAAGVLLGLHPLTGLLAVSIWSLTFMATRTSSFAALLAVVVALPMLCWQQPALLVPLTLLASCIIWRHRHNLQALRYGRERHF